MSGSTAPGGASAGDALQRRADAFTSDSGLVGLAVACIDGSTTFAFNGFADRESEEPVCASTVFRVGSITKTFVALAAMRLAEEGCLDVEAAANDYLHSFKVQWPEDKQRVVTIAQLLTHTAGLDPGFEGISVDADVLVPDPSEMYGSVVHARWAPGSGRRYSNHGYVVLGQVVEDVVGLPLPEALTQLVFQPLGMTATSLVEPAEHAQGYGTDGAVLRPVHKQTMLAAAGAAWSSAVDMSRYVEALLNGGANGSGRVVSADTLQRMLTEQVAGPDLVMGTSDSQGFGFKILTADGRRLVRHAGSFAGFCAALYIDGDAHRGVAVLTNTRGRGFQVFREVDAFAGGLAVRPS